MEYKFLLANYNFNVDDITKFFGIEDKNLKMIDHNFKGEISGNQETLLINLTLDNKDDVDACLNAMICKILKDEELDEISMQEILNRVKSYLNSIDSNQLPTKDELNQGLLDQLNHVQKIKNIIKVIKLRKMLIKRKLIILMLIIR